jgi:hypothetical protein
MNFRRLNRSRPIRSFPSPLLALLSIAFAAVSMALGQDTNTHAGAAGGGTNSQQKFRSMTFEEAMKPAPGGSDTNSKKKFIPPSPNSIVFQDARTAQPVIQSPTNTTVSLKEWQARAERGDASAQYDLGWFYYSGEGLPQNYAEAVKWTRKAAEQGHAYAQYNLGCFYHNGQGVSQDYVEEAKWYRRAAEQGIGGAQFAIANAYYFGQGVPQDYSQAVKWFRKAAEQGDASAQHDLGVAYRDGQGIKQDYQEAARWFRKSAEQGLLQGQYDLSWCYQTGNGVAQDYTEAVIWLRKPAEQGNTRPSQDRKQARKQCRMLVWFSVSCLVSERPAAITGHL